MTITVMDTRLAIREDTCSLCKRRINKKRDSLARHYRKKSILFRTKNIELSSFCITISTGHRFSHIKYVAALSNM